MIRRVITYLFYLFLLAVQVVITPIERRPVVTDVCICRPENAYKPEVDEVLLRDEGENGLMQNARIYDSYQLDVMSSGVVGLVGAPFSVSYDTQVESPLLVFHYVPEELRGIPERNLIILHYDADSSFYVQVGEEDLNREECTISVHIREPGTYLLADRYQWYSVWGEDVSEYAYTVAPGDYLSDWERECAMGSIPEIADKEWAIEHAPVFHVSTPEQLAGVVYYVNAISGESDNIELYLEQDIDLEGYDWVPMGWLGAAGHHYNGLIDGQGHVIKNMDLHISYEGHCAFVGYSTGLKVCNISFTNAKISGGIYTGIVGGEIYMSKEWENIHVDGMIRDATGEVGSIVGREAYLHFKDCSAEVFFEDSTGTTSLLPYFSYRLEVIDKTPVTEDFTLWLEEDGTITRTEKEGFLNLCWHVEVDGCQVLQRGAENELAFNPSMYIEIPEGATWQVWLEAFTGETYTRVSNVIEGN